MVYMWDFYLAEEGLYEIVELCAVLFQRGDILCEDHFDEFLEARGNERRMPRGQFIEDAAQAPEVRVEAVNAAVLEELWGHVVGSASFSLLKYNPIRKPTSYLALLSLIRLNQVNNLLRQPKVPVFQIPVLVYKDVRGLHVAVDYSL